jgi:hypothetical protein
VKPPRFNSVQHFRPNRGGFTLDGHRLLSLYRRIVSTAPRLMIRYSSWKKYLTGVRGCETPALSTR